MQPPIMSYALFVSLANVESQCGILAPLFYYSEYAADEYKRNPT